MRRMMKISAPASNANVMIDDAHPAAESVPMFGNGHVTDKIGKSNPVVTSASVIALMRETPDLYANADATSQSAAMKKSSVGNCAMYDVVDASESISRLYSLFLQILYQLARTSG